MAKIEDLQIQALTKEMILLFMAAAKYGKGTGGLTSDQIVELTAAMRRVTGKFVHRLLVEPVESLLYGDVHGSET